MDDKVVLTREIIRGGGNAGGFTYAQLRLLGVEAPPPKGWIKDLIGYEVPRSLVEKFYALQGKTFGGTAPPPTITVNTEITPAMTQAGISQLRSMLPSNILDDPGGYDPEVIVKRVWQAMSSARYN